ncbi:hypothetical protein PCASD_18545 [Puccinia coronata f. sp. avenae]|uniref:Uncharacterized protein n=1 Tax=Puccinia coronata f. sp. avenae TaxID=200324 RepID=A0A2N5U129_9BASI|nr:hypothetical protein PCASD_18545 [Puccinia coronata f. sp. avenae]
MLQAAQLSLITQLSDKNITEFLKTEHQKIKKLSQSKPGAPTGYGTGYVRVGIEEEVYQSICSKVGQAVKLKDPPIERVSSQAGLRIFTVTMPKGIKVQSLAEAEDPSAGPSESMVTVPDPSSVFTIGLDVMASCYFMVKAKYKGPAAGLRIFTVTMPKGIKVQSLAEAKDPEDPSAGPSESMVTVPDPSSVFTIGLDVMASCYFMVKAKYKGPAVSVENVQMDLMHQE